MSSKVLAGAALLVPVAVCAALVPVRDSFNNTNAALLLVLVIVGFAATGHRGSGIVAALSAGAAFDFFLTQPYERFAIHEGNDVEAAVLLLLVGIGVTELAVWGRRQQAAASRDEGYLDGISAASEVVARGTLSPSDLIERVCDQLTVALGLRSCRFDYGMDLEHPRLHRNGEVTWRREHWDIRVLPLRPTGRSSSSPRAVARFEDGSSSRSRRRPH
jgi:K+-sensing histidine kinase KdpD